jgi:hypothetical protein
MDVDPAVTKCVVIKKNGWPFTVGANHHWEAITNLFENGPERGCNKKAADYNGAVAAASMEQVGTDYTTIQLTVTADPENVVVVLFRCSECAQNWVPNYPVGGPASGTSIFKAQEAILSGDPTDISCLEVKDGNTRTITVKNQQGIMAWSWPRSGH